MCNATPEGYLEGLLDGARGARRTNVGTPRRAGAGVNDQESIAIG